ncbi:MAG TPA: hypothetical protein ENN25_01570 [Euryarchaeota archaeon]|nr:hypothetical protein [Euryarchaeota archaeon]
MRSHRIAVFTGPGASNSWVWLADFLENNGFYEARFHSDWESILDSDRNDIVVIPGGDTFRIAQLFGKDGLETLKNRISEGTGYVGICAGAYLPLRSSVSPLSSFNLTDIRISNLTSNVPDDLIDPDRYTVPYGCSLVYHPVRGAVSFSGDVSLEAPLYGGPFMIPQNGSRVRLIFESLSSRSEPLIDRDRCEELISGKAGCIEYTFGEGRLLLLSPHLEHPEYPEANEYLTRLLADFPIRSYSEAGRPIGSRSVELPQLKRIVADLMARSSALDFHSWKVGIKYWESEKMLFFVEAIRRRLKKLNRAELKFSEEFLTHLKYAIQGLSSISRGEDTPESVDNLVQHLSSGASVFLNQYFAHLEAEDGI